MALTDHHGERLLKRLRAVPYGVTVSSNYNQWIIAPPGWEFEWAIPHQFGFKKTAATSIDAVLDGNAWLAKE